MITYLHYPVMYMKENRHPLILKVLNVHDFAGYNIATVIATTEPGSGASRENEAANETSNQASAVASSDSSTSVTLSELLDYVELSPSALKKKCTEEHLRDIAREMDNWEYYASNLGLSTGEIDDLKEEFRKTGVKKERCLLIWKQKAGFKANYGYLVNVFLRCKNAEMAEYVCRLLK